MQLHKLIYFAHGWYLALTGKSLIRDMIKAWPYGPVTPSIYDQFKHFGAKPIEINEWGKTVDLKPIKNRKTREILEAVWNTYSKYSAYQLSSITHRVDSPWSETRRKNPTSFGSIIPNSLIEKYFSDLKRRNARTI